jgi:hypothetical protein
LLGEGILAQGMAGFKIQSSTARLQAPKKKLLALLPAVKFFNTKIKYKINETLITNDVIICLGFLGFTNPPKKIKKKLHGILLHQ